jgi:hypothetical protein
MHAPGKRALHHRRHRTGQRAVAVAAVFGLSALLWATDARPATDTAASGIEYSGLPQATEIPPAVTAVHDIAIETVSSGSEGLELSARLSEDGGLIERPVSWTIQSSDGQTIYQGEVPIADVVMSPGDYSVGLTYGFVHQEQSFTVVAGTRLIASFVLNAGGIRVLPRLENIGLPSSPSESLIYALSGSREGQLVTTSTIPGEILRVPAGDYRVESHFANGNARAVADVRVKPGILSAVEIDHQAGLARLSFVGAPGAHVLWRLEDANGVALPEIAGLVADVVLKPGTYRAIAQTGDEMLSAQFDITAGQSRDIILGN